MEIRYKTPAEIKKLKSAGKVVAEVLDLISENVRPGVTTAKLDKLAADHFEKRKAKPAFLGYQGFPANICVSIDNEVVHGIPSDRRLEEGQIVSVDVGSIVDGYYGDSARTFAVGKIDKKAQSLINVTKESLNKAIKVCVQGKRLGDISAAVQNYVEMKGYSVVRDLVGHGIGKSMHEEPQVPNFGKSGTGIHLQEGLVIAIEPMINAGKSQVKVLQDGWTIVTSDGSLSAHFEHTVAITANGPEILTLR
jgi:methionyl aminopeptidase